MEDVGVVMGNNSCSVAKFDVLYSEGSGFSFFLWDETIFAASATVEEGSGEEVGRGFFSGGISDGEDVPEYCGR